MSYPPPGPGPNELTCPCFDGEDLLAITRDNVSSGSCYTTVTNENCQEHLCQEFILTEIDGNPFFGIIGRENEPGSEFEYSCIVNDQEEVISNDETADCYNLLNSRCREISSCPCFDEEDLSVITAANVSEDSCVLKQTETGSALSVSDQDGDPSFGISTTSSPTQQFFACNVDGEEKNINSVQAESCGQIIQSRCEEVNSCPCFDEEDLSVITAANVSDDSCVPKSTDAGGGLTLSLSDQDGDPSFGIAADYVGTQYSCNINGEEETITSTQLGLGFPPNPNSCVQIIRNRCEDIGKPF